MDIEAEIERLYSGNKTFSVPPAWHYDGQRNERWVMTVALDIDYVTEEGLYLEGCCLASLPDQNVSMSLTYKPAGGMHGAIARLDWLPLSSHSNQGRISGEWKWKEIAGTHLHGYEMNRGRGWDFMARNNLPIALPVNETLSDFRGMLGFVGQIWKISDVQRIPVPEWHARLDLR